MKSMRLKELLEKQLSENCNRTISCTGEESHSYRQVLSASRNLALQLRNYGLRPGDRIAICACNSIEWIEVFFAALLGEFVPVIISDKFNTPQKQAILDQSKCSALFLESQFYEQLDLLQCPSLKIAFDIDSQEQLMFRNIDYTNNLTPHDVCAILYSSGSTGNPKGVMITNCNLLWNIKAFVSLCPYCSGDTYVSILPFSHIFGLVSDLLTCIYSGVNLYIVKGIPSPNKIYPIFQRYNPRLFFAVPLLLEKIVDAAQRQDNTNIDYHHFFGNRLEHLITGGAPISSATEHYLIDELRLPFHSGYGMTETAPLISFGRITDYKIGSCGEYIDGLEVRIKEIDGLNGAGEIQVKGDNVFAGYLSNEEATQSCFTNDGWFKTGDIGRLEQRTLYITGRLKNILLFSNGINVDATDIENEVNKIDEVAESLVFQDNDNIIIVTYILDYTNCTSDLTNKIKRVLSDFSLTYKIGQIIVVNNPLERTAKGSLKRCIPDGIVIYSNK